MAWRTAAVAVLFGCASVSSGDPGSCTADSVRVETEGGDPFTGGPLTKVDECKLEVQDCAYCYAASPTVTECTDWRSKHGDENPKGKSWLVYAAYAIGALMAFGIGGNDSANSLATCVGSGALPLNQAVVLGAVGEFLGALFLGQGVSSTIQKGVARVDDPECWACGYCNNQMDVYQFGMLATLSGAAFFLLVVTFISLPVSTTHAVVGGAIGMTIAGVGHGCLNVSGILNIAAGWVVSPLGAGFIGALTYIVLHYLIMKRAKPAEAAIQVIPYLYSITVAIMVFLTLNKAGLTKKLSMSVKVLSSLVSFVIVTLIAWWKVVPQMRTLLAEVAEESAQTAKPKPWVLMRTMTERTLESGRGALIKATDESESVELSKVPNHDTNGNGTAQYDPGTGLELFTQADPTPDQQVAKSMFKNLLVLTAFMQCFAHGANDTANATGPVGAVGFVYEAGIHACGDTVTPWYVMGIAGLCVGAGVILMGKYVIKTIGEELADIDFHVGFCVMFASASAVVVATLLGLPVSTTHCQVGSIVFVAATAYGCQSVAWSMFGKIAITWVATLPLAGGTAWAIMLIRYGY